MLRKSLYVLYGYDPDYRPFAAAESDCDLWNRLLPFYQEIMSNKQERSLIVLHGTALSFLQSMLVGVPLRILRESVLTVVAVRYPKS